MSRTPLQCPARNDYNSSKHNLGHLGALLPFTALQLCPWSFTVATQQVVSLSPWQNSSLQTATTKVINHGTCMWFPCQYTMHSHSTHWVYVLMSTVFVGSIYIVVEKPCSASLSLHALHTHSHPVPMPASFSVIQCSYCANTMSFINQ